MNIKTYKKLIFQVRSQEYGLHILGLFQGLGKKKSLKF